MMCTLKREEGGSMLNRRRLFAACCIVILGLATAPSTGAIGSPANTPAGVTAAAGIIPAGIIPPIPPPGQISQGPNCPTNYNPSDYPRYISKLNNNGGNTVPNAIHNHDQV